MDSLHHNIYEGVSLDKPENQTRKLASGPSDSFADRLNYLFDNLYPVGRGPYSNAEVAAGVERAGYKVTSHYLWMLRTRRRTNPTLDLLGALAKFFGIPAGYFFDCEEAGDIKKQLEILEEARAAQVKEIFFRSTEIEEQDRAVILRILRSFSARENSSPERSG
ncbi:hypothetical protein Ae706Ps2_6465c [Pseudonocardia sp. Ae706_Ps2]|nr:hypothetical protein Ae706Ps2_6465c [Pseudonocardia sp. Ae706_Ps2]